MYLRSVAEGTLRPLTPPGVVVWRDTVSPDGSRLLASCADGPLTCVYPLDGSPPAVLQVPWRRGAIAGWADERTAYLRDFGLPVSVARLDVVTGRLEPWRWIGPTELSGIMRVNALSIAADGAYAYSFSRVLSDLYVVSGLK
jgi:hypothetical protein